MKNKKISLIFPVYKPLAVRFRKEEEGPDLFSIFETGELTIYITTPENATRTDVERVASYALQEVLSDYPE